MTTSEKESRSRFYQKISKMIEVFEAEKKQSYFNYFEKLAISAIITGLQSMAKLEPTTA